MKVLVDTSVWVHHLSRGHARLAERLERGEVLCHPFVIGELACGQMRRRGEILDLLARLPQAQVADHEELLHLIERHDLSGQGLGWIDVHLLGSARLTACRIWTTDRALRDAARRLGLYIETDE